MNKDRETMRQQRSLWQMAVQPFKRISTFKGGFGHQRKVRVLIRIFFLKKINK